MGSDPLDYETFWHGQRINGQEGDISFHAFGPKDAFIVFEGPTAKDNYDAWMKLVNGEKDNVQAGQYKVVYVMTPPESHIPLTYRGYELVMYQIDRRKWYSVYKEGNIVFKEKGIVATRKRIDNCVDGLRHPQGELDLKDKQ